MDNLQNGIYKLDTLAEKIRNVINIKYPTLSKKRNKHSLGNLWENTEKCNICTVWVPGWREREWKSSEWLEICKNWLKKTWIHMFEET